MIAYSTPSNQIPRQFVGLNQASRQRIGLAACWPMIFDTGKAVLDAVRFNNVAFPGSTNNPISAARNVVTGYNLSFVATGYQDANRDYISVPAVSLSTEHTMAYWLYYSNYTSLAYGGVAVGYDNNYYFDWISGATRSSAFGSANIASCTSGIVKSSWQHLAIVRNGTGVTFYLNGKQDGSPATLGSNNAVTISVIGAATTVYNGYYGFNGGMADVRLYNRALSPAEIWSMYDPATRWELYQPPRPMIWWIPPVDAATNIIPLVMHHRKQQGIS